MPLLLLIKSLAGKNWGREDLTPAVVSGRCVQALGRQEHDFNRGFVFLVGIVDLSWLKERRDKAGDSSYTWKGCVWAPLLTGNLHLTSLILLLTHSVLPFLPPITCSFPVVLLQFQSICSYYQPKARH